MKLKKQFSLDSSLAMSPIAVEWSASIVGIPHTFRVPLSYYLMLGSIVVESCLYIPSALWSVMTIALSEQMNLRQSILLLPAFFY